MKGRCKYDTTFWSKAVEGPSGSLPYSRPTTFPRPQSTTIRHHLQRHELGSKPPKAPRISQRLALECRDCYRHRARQGCRRIRYTRPSRSQLPPGLLSQPVGGPVRKFDGSTAQRYAQRRDAEGFDCRGFAFETALLCFVRYCDSERSCACQGSNDFLLISLSLCASAGGLWVVYNRQKVGGR